MAFKFVIFSALVAVATAGYITQDPTHYAAVTPVVVTKAANPSVDAVATTQQNVVRSFGGTVSQYSKSIQTPYSSVHKEDTRISNNVYTPTVTKTLTYAAPEATAVYTSHEAPVVTKMVYSAPQIHEEQQNHVYVSSAAPTATVYTHAAPTANVYTHSVPSAGVYTHSSPSANVYSHSSNIYAHPAPTAAVYTHSAPTTTVYHHEVPYTATTTYNHGPTAAVYHQEIPTTATATTTHNHGTPGIVYHQEVPSTATTTTTYHQAPTATVYQHEVPSTATTTYNHGAATTSYSHNGHGVSAYGTKQTVRYSPAEMVSHMSFDGFGTHWGY